MLTIESDGTILYKGKVVGSHSFADGISSVNLNISYSTHSDDWVTPISLLACGLAALEPPTERSIFTISTSEDEIGEVYEVPTALLEHWLRHNGHKWDFHMSDVDPWPSPFHAHDYSAGLKLDVITGHIYDVVSRKKVKTLRPKVVAEIHAKLRKAKTLEALVNSYLPPNDEAPDQA